MVPALALAIVLTATIPATLIEAPRVATTLPPVVPWVTFSESASASAGSRIGQCPGGREILISALHHRGDLHAFFFDPASQQIMWVYQPGGGEPTWVGTGRGADPPRHDLIPPLQWLPIATAEARWPGGPCDYFKAGSA